MSVSNPNKTVTPSAIDCEGLATVKISFRAEPEIVQTPVDVALILDRSSSMRGQPLVISKKAANQFVTMLSESTGGLDSGLIGGKSRIGIVSFGTDATEDAALTNDVSLLKNTINGIQASGQTNHSAAFAAARRILNVTPANKKVAVMFTDGSTNIGGSANAIAEELKAEGIEIYCIGFIANAADISVWASDPDSTHVASSSDPEKITELFQRIALDIIKPGAQDAVIEEVLNPDFRLVRVNPPTHGVYQVTSPNSFRWTIGTTGSSAPADVSISFDIAHSSPSGGLKKVNKSLTYGDKNGNTLLFPEPEINIDCSAVPFFPEPCPVPTDFTVDSCKDAAIINLSDAELDSLGRIVQVNAVIKNVCPGKRIAAAFILTEKGPNGAEYNRGMKTVMIPAQTGTGCRDVIIKCVRFAVPEDPSDPFFSSSICGERNFRVRVIANYADTDFVCCDAGSVTI